MSIASEIQRLSGIRSDIFDSITNKGVTVPESATFSSCPDLIDSIQTGGGGGSNDFLYNTAYTASGICNIVGDFTATQNQVETYGALDKTAYNQVVKNGFSASAFNGFYINWSGVSADIVRQGVPIQVYSQTAALTKGTPVKTGSYTYSALISSNNGGHNYIYRNTGGPSLRVWTAALNNAVNSSFFWKYQSAFINSRSADWNNDTTLFIGWYGSSTNTGTVARLTGCTADAWVYGKKIGYPYPSRPITEVSSFTSVGTATEHIDYDVQNSEWTPIITNVVGTTPYTSITGDDISDCKISDLSASVYTIAESAFELSKDSVFPIATYPSTAYTFNSASSVNYTLDGLIGG